VFAQVQNKNTGPSTNVIVERPVAPVAPLRPGAQLQPEPHRIRQYLILSTEKPYAYTR